MSNPAADILPEIALRGAREPILFLALRLIVLFIFLLGCLGVIVGAVDEKQYLIDAGAHLVEGTVFLVVALFVIHLLVRFDKRDYVERLRAERFAELEQRVSTSIKLAFPHPLSTHRCDADQIENYRPAGAFGNASVEQLREYRNKWRFAKVLEDNCIYLIYELRKPAAKVAGQEPIHPRLVPLCQPIVISLWNCGDQVRIGAFILTKLVEQVAGASAATELVDRTKELMLCEQKLVQTRVRHSTTLVECVIEQKRLLLDPFVWDLLAAQFSNLATHLMVDAFNIIETAEASKNNAS